jgi:epoxide hydrolase 4
VPPAEVPLLHGDVFVGGVRLHLVQAGREDGPPVLLLHGFPESWLAWRRQFAELAAAGFRMTAPVGRGYDLSDKPAAIRDYAMSRLTADALGVLDALQASTACVVGHDWGGIIAWRLAALHPERVERLVVINAPHPDAFRRVLLTSPRQFVRSTYALFFQLPYLPEAVLRSRDHGTLVRALLRTSRPGTFSEADLAAYRQAWSRPGALTGMLNWYRAAARWPGATPRVRVPTLLLWGARDAALGFELARRSIELCDDGRLEVLEDATHWVQHEESAAVNRAIVAFFGGQARRAP